MRYAKFGRFATGTLFAIGLAIAATTIQSAQTESLGPPPMAVLRGKIRFTGTAPAVQRLNMAGDAYCASFVNTAETVRVSDQGLENVMVFVSSPVGGIAPTRAVVTLDQRDCRFDPHVLTLQAGQTLIVQNSDKTLSNVHAFTQINAPYNIGQPGPMKATHIFDKPEVPIPIRDDVHGWKSAVIGVFSHSYHTVSKTGGLFELTMPVGTYEITAMHEVYGASKQMVTVRPGENPALDFVFKEP